MKVDPARFVVGDEWAYRLRDNAPSERVRIQTVTPRKNSTRVDVIFLDDPTLRVENVPGSRLRVPWEEAEAYDTVMAQWQRINNQQLDKAEEAAVEQVFLLLIPAEVATWEWRPVRNTAATHDSAALEEILRCPVQEILDGIEWFDLDGTIMLSPAGTLRIAEAACKANPTPVLDLILEEEAEARSKCKHGSEHVKAQTQEVVAVAPECEYLWYRESDLPRHELLRQWCGHRAVTQQERLRAAEAEVQRLDVLLAAVIKALEQAGADLQARVFDEEHERNRITPYTVRPSVDEPPRPL